MKYIKVAKHIAEKTKRALINNGLLSRDYPVFSDKSYVSFPVISKELPSGLKFEIIEIQTEKKQVLELRELLKDKLTKEELEILPRGFDTVGSIAIIELTEQLKPKSKLIGKAILKLHKNIKTVVSKASERYGEYRLQKYEHLAGESTFETIHRENNIVLKIDIQKTYFSSRLANERLRIAKQVKPGEKVLVMFSGTGPYCFVIAKNSEAAKVVGVELNPEAHSYSIINKNINKLDNVELILGDVISIIPKLNEKFDRIVMPLPKIGESFLSCAFSAAKQNAVIHYYAFESENTYPDATIDKIKREAAKKNLKIKVLHAVICGSYAPRVYRICIDFKLLFSR